MVSTMLFKPGLATMSLGLFALFLASCSNSHSLAQLSNISTDPPGPPPGIFRWTLDGTGIAKDVKVVITDRGCEAGCVLDPVSITSRSSSRLVGVADLTNGAGTYRIQVIQDGATSRALEFRVGVVNAPEPNAI
jgi:hypothetical protein